jgi:hypothetical protein
MSSKSTVVFDLSSVNDLVFVASNEALAVAENFLKDQLPSGTLFDSQVDQEKAKKLKDLAQKVRQVFDETQPGTQEEKQGSYLSFVSALNELDKNNSSFSKLLKERKIMDQVCKSIGKIFYGKENTEGVKVTVGDHINLMKSAWLPVLGKQEERLRRSPE